MINDDLPEAIALTRDERMLLSQAINEYWGPAGTARFLLGPIVGATSTAEWDALLQRLYDALVDDRPLTNLEWSRALFLAEISIGSQLVGARLDSARTVNGQNVFDVLESVQRKVSSSARFELLLENSECRLAEPLR